VPLPGETALIAAGVLASRGDLALPLVVAAAAAGAIVGDNVGYAIGRRGGRWLLTRQGPLAERRERFVARGERFFARHGAKTVFFGRWLPVLRITAAWLAGVNRMPWLRFFLWNALGGMSWAATVGVAAYFVGEAASTVVGYVGIGGIALVAVAVTGFLGWRLLRR
jgi:membrane-associated protein